MTSGEPQLQVSRNTRRVLSRQRILGHAMLGCWAFHTINTWSHATGLPVPVTPDTFSLTIDPESATLEDIHDWIVLLTRSSSITPFLPAPTEALDTPASGTFSISPRQTLNSAGWHDEQIAEDVNNNYATNYGDTNLQNVGPSTNSDEFDPGSSVFVDDLPDVALPGAPYAADIDAQIGDWTELEPAHNASSMSEDREMQAYLENVLQINTTKEVEVEQLTTHSSFDHTQQQQSFNETPQYEYPSGVEHTHTDDTYQSAQYTLHSPLNDFELISAAEIPRWEDIGIPNLYPVADTITPTAYSTPDTAHTYAARASTEQYLDYAPYTPTSPGVIQKASNPSVHRPSPNATKQMLPPPSPISNEKKSNKRKRSECSERLGISSPLSPDTIPPRKRRVLSAGSPLKYESPSPFNMTIRPWTPEEVSFMVPTPRRDDAQVNTPGPSGIKSTHRELVHLTEPVDSERFSAAPIRPGRKGKERAYPRSFSPYPNLSSYSTSTPRLRPVTLPTIQLGSPLTDSVNETTPVAYYASAVPSPTTTPIAGPSSHTFRPTASHRVLNEDLGIIPAAVLATGAPVHAITRPEVLQCPLQGCDVIFSNTRAQILDHVTNICQSPAVVKMRASEFDELATFGSGTPRSGSKCSIQCDECRTRPVMSLDSWVKHISEKHSKVQKCDRCNAAFASYKEMTEHWRTHRRRAAQGTSVKPVTTSPGETVAQRTVSYEGGNPFGAWELGNRP